MLTKPVDINSFKVRGFFLQYDFGVIQILIKTYKNTQKLKIKSEQRKYFLF